MAQCMFPFHVENTKFRTASDAHWIPVPCGKCPNCLKRRVNQWAFRLKKEEEVSTSSFFVTLTYDTHSVPISDNGYMTLRKTDLQNYFKRLRKLNHEKIKYYACGEYGTKGQRPHYHIILFNSTESSIVAAWCLNGNSIGHVDVGTVSGASISYTLKYINKGFTVPRHANDDRQREFSLQSKGMGASYLTAPVVAHHKANLQKAYITTEDGHKIPIPRYYKDKLYTEQERTTQNKHLKKIMVEKPSTMTDREIHESRKAAIKNFRKQYTENRKDI